MTLQRTTTRRPDRRVLRTRKAIMNAFDKLISSGSAEKITVSAIARTADIDRKTFYLHYKSVDDLANQKASDIIERIVLTLKAEGAGKTHLERVHLALAELNAIVTSNIPLYTNVASSLSTDEVLEHLTRAAEPALANAGFNAEITKNRQLYMSMQFFVAGSIYLYCCWLKSDRTTPIESVSNGIEETIAVLYRQGANAQVHLLREA